MGPLELISALAGGSFDIPVKAHQTFWLSLWAICIWHLLVLFQLKLDSVIKYASSVNQLAIRHRATSVSIWRPQDINALRSMVATATEPALPIKGNKMPHPSVVNADG